MRALSFATVFSALSGFVLLFVISRTLGPDLTAELMAYWGLFFAFTGLIDGLMQETTRAVAAAQTGASISADNARPMRIAAVIAASLVVVALLTGPLWIGQLLSQHHNYALGLFEAGLAAYCYQAVLSGVLSGLRLWRQYAWLVALDAGVRFVLVVVAWLAGWGLEVFVFITVVGALSWLVIIACSAPARCALAAPTDVSTMVFARRAGAAMLATGATAALVTGFPAAVKATSQSSAAVTLGGIIMAVTLTRAPILVPLQRFQSALIVRFVDHRDHILRALPAPVLAVLGVGALGAVPAFVVGPWFMRTFFGAGFDVPGQVLAVLTFAAACTGALMITSAAVLAAELHRLYVFGWVVATGVAFSMLVLPYPVEVRVCAALIAGPVAGGLVQAVGLAVVSGRLRARHRKDTTFIGDRMRDMPTLTALVTVYHRIDPGHFRQCLDSLSAQTRPAEEVVIVEDGPLGPQLRAVVEQFLSTYAGARSVVLARNMGPGLASAAGLAAIGSVFMARLDADDLAHPERFERQLDFFEQHPEVDVLGTAMSEFEDSTDTIVGVRRLPASHAELARYAQRDCPINNPSVMMRVQAVRDVGGYRDVQHMEDYDLYARLIARGKRLHNMPEALTYFRTSTSVFQRRTGKGMFSAERQMQKNLVAYGIISPRRAWLNLVVRSMYRLLPSSALKAAYGRLFHRR